jgi:hypothetical protein
VVLTISPDEVSEVDEEQSLVVVCLDVSQYLFDFIFCSLEELEIVILYINISVLASLLKRYLKKASPK